MHTAHLNKIFFLTILGVVGYGAYLVFAPFVGSIFFAVILAILFYGPYQRLVAYLSGRASLAASLMLLVVALTIIVPLVAVSAFVVTQAADVVSTIDLDLSRIADLQGRLGPLGALLPRLSDGDVVSQETVANVAQQIGAIAVTIAQKTYAVTAGSIVGIFVLFFTLFFLFVDGEHLVRRLMYLSPLPDRHEKRLFARFASMSRATLKGTLVIGLVQGTLGAAVFLIAGVPSVGVWWIALTTVAIIPLLGPGVIGFPVALYYLVTGDATAAAILAIGFTVIAFFDNYLRPILVGRDTQMHTLLVFFATLGGITAFGLMGFIIGPIIMALFVTLLDIYGEEFDGQLNDYNA